MLVLLTPSQVDRVDYSNDTATSSERGNLAENIDGHASVGDQNFAYVGGGAYSNVVKSTTQRIDYSNDTATAVTKGPLSRC